tara:strand:+ start:496 stop:960 length:465 start_codon:yes stop_codon:yes gene_type:complete
MPRELLKFRPGDCGLKIKKDGSIEVAGVDEAGGMIDKKGMVNPALLFASAWARKDQKVFQVLLDNFKESVREGYFGEEAKKDYEKALKTQEEHAKSLQEQNIAVKKPPVPFMKMEEPVLDPDSKPTVDAVASGAVTFEQPAPMTVDEHLDRRDS